MLRLTYTADGSPRTLPLAGGPLTVGRARGSSLQLADPSVSRLHCELAAEGPLWVVRDRDSTNGVFVNGVAVKKAPLHPGDRVRIGVFELAVEGEEEPPPAEVTVAPASAHEPFGDATIVRPVAEVAGGLGLGAPADGSLAAFRAAAAPGYGERVAASMIRLAGFLIRADSLDAVLARVMDAAFEALPVDRGFILLGEGDGLVCELARFEDRVEVRPGGELPVSTTMLQAVIDRQVALVTTDARADARLLAGESIRIHQIRSAMCAPLWSGERIVGAMQLDTSFRVGAFGERDLELACALANYAAVAVERIRFASRAEQERQLRARLERYHSPAVVEEVLREEAPPLVAGGRRRPMKAADVTVLFADVVGFTPLAEGAAPEAVAALLGGFFDRAIEAIFAAGGTLDKFIGDCVMAFFGAPVAQPDHARRALDAALAIQREMGSWNRERAARGEPPVGVRIALNSGPVVVGEVGSERRVDYTVLGNTVNVASRLEESAARAGEVVIGPGTYERVGAGVAVEPLGELRLEGLARPVAAYRVTAEGG
jgi:adenylate cyclase